MDSASASSLGTLESLVWRVLSGLTQLDVTAELSGSLRSPRFSVHSNIDEAIAERVRGILGEELRAAEARVRAQVDSLVSGEIDKARTQAESATSELRSRVASVKQELESAKAQLEARLRALSGGLGGVLGQ
jgi:multidrug resistance efflux pump